MGWEALGRAYSDGMPGPVIHLVRHGESTWNLEGRLQGQTHGVPLTERGRRQAREAAGVLAERVDGRVGIWSSDQVRALETARVIGERLGCPVTETPALREQGLGDLEGRLTSELTAEPTPAGCHVSEVRWGGGESIRDVHVRVGAFLGELPREPLDHVVLVTHGDTLRVALAWLEGRSHRDVSWRVVGNGEVVTVTGC